MMSNPASSERETYLGHFPTTLTYSHVEPKCGRPSHHPRLHRRSLGPNREGGREGPACRRFDIRRPPRILACSMSGACPRLQRSNSTTILSRHQRLYDTVIAQAPTRRTVHLCFSLVVGDFNKLFPACRATAVLCNATSTPRAPRLCNTRPVVLCAFYLSRLERLEQVLYTADLHNMFGKPSRCTVFVIAGLWPIIPSRLSAMPP